MSSFVIAAPEVLVAVSADLVGVGVGLEAAASAAAGPMVGVVAAGGDEVSAVIAWLFGAYARDYLGLGARAAVFHAEFVQALRGAGGGYGAAEATGAAALASVGVRRVYDAPTEAVMERPLVGDGANGTAAHPNGYDGGIVSGNGGARGIPGRPGRGWPAGKNSIGD